MKTKKFYIVLAAMLLTSVCAFAQSGNQPLKGDVNEDGKVDVTDIVAVVNIIMNGGSTPQPTTYYWYVGITTPTEVDTDNIMTSETEIGWHACTGTPTSIHIGQVSNSTKVNWVVLIPTALNITKVSNGDDVTDAYTVDTIDITGTNYRRWTQLAATKKFDYDMIQ